MLSFISFKSQVELPLPRGTDCAGLGHSDLHGSLQLAEGCSPEWSFLFGSIADGGGKGSPVCGQFPSKFPNKYPALPASLGDVGLVGEEEQEWMVLYHRISGL